MTELSPTPFARRLDGLVESARAARDGAFNSLDAVNRQTRSACDGLVREAQYLIDAVAEQAGDRAGTEPDRDARFDPEDEWELPAAAQEPPPADAQRIADNDAASSETDYSDYPDTWLR